LGFTPFIAACANWNKCKQIIDYFRKLKDPKVNLHARSYDGQSAVHRAAYYG
jgi:hypothetical protein